MLTPICEGISAVGYIDWGVRDFHGYETDKGTTYNSYLLQFDKTVLIDSVKAPFAPDLIQTLASATSLSKLDYIVVNHSEPDHSGAMPLLMNLAPQAVVICNKRCQDFLSKYYNTTKWNFQIVKTGDTLSIGAGKTLHFVEIPMVHWPDSMATYLAEEEILFPNDAFGEHYATNRRFDDENSLTTLINECKSYYANIVNPYSKQVVGVLKALGGLPIRMICPSHGVIWRKNLPEILKAYDNWANQRVQPKVAIVYDTMWHRTDKLAEAIVDGVTSVPGVQVRLLPVRANTENLLATEALDSACFALGSSTLNQLMMPQMAATMCYFQGLKFTGRAGLSFGSRGWGKGGPEALDAKLDELQWERLAAPVIATFEPTAEVIQQCREAGVILANKALELSKASNYQPLCID